MGGKGIWSRFVPLKVGLLEHVQTGRMSANMLAVFTALILAAKRDGNTGVVWTSAVELAGWLKGLSRDSAKRALRSLIASGYLRSFATPGVHGRYPLGIHNFLAPQEQESGAPLPRYLNARAMDGWDRPMWGDAPHRAPQVVPLTAPLTAPQSAPPFHSRKHEHEQEVIPAVADAPAPKPPKRPRREKPADPAPTGPLIEFWQTAEKVDGIEPHGSYGAHAAILRTAWQACGRDLERTYRAISAFMQCRDDFSAVRQGRSVTEFKRTLTRWVREANGTAPAPTKSFQSKSDRQVSAFGAAMQLEPGDHVPLIGGPE